MTNQEIQRFVNQPTPRNVPKNVFRAAAKYFRCKIMKQYSLRDYFFVIAVGSLLLFTIAFMDIVKDGFHVEQAAIIVGICVINCFYLFEHWRLKRFLTNARYASGIIVETDSSKSLSKGKAAKWLGGHLFRGFVSFRDLYGGERTDAINIAGRTAASFSQWASEQRSVGLLYLPDSDRAGVIITDLWSE